MRDKLTPKNKRYCCVADMILSISHKFPEKILRNIYKKKKNIKIHINKMKKSRWMKNFKIDKRDKEKTDWYDFIKEPRKIKP